MVLPAVIFQLRELHDSGIDGNLVVFSYFPVFFPPFIFPLHEHLMNTFVARSGANAFDFQAEIQDALLNGPTQRSEGKLDSEATPTSTSMLMAMPTLFTTETNVECV